MSPKGNDTVSTVFQTRFFGGAGDATLTPSHVRRHAPFATHGAVLRPCFRSHGRQGFQTMTPAQPTPPIDPLARPDVLRILLGPTASARLTESGAECFAIVGKVTWPGDASRWAIYLLPVPLAGANAATSVLLGTHRAAPIRRPSPQPTPDTATPANTAALPHGIGTKAAAPADGSQAPEANSGGTAANVGAPMPLWEPYKNAKI